MQQNLTANCILEHSITCQRINFLVIFSEIGFFELLLSRSLSFILHKRFPEADIKS